MRPFASTTTAEAIVYLRKEHRGSGAGGIGTFGMVDFFDDSTGGDTFGERVMRCPGCNLWLYYRFGVEPSDLAQPR